MNPTDDKVVNGLKIVLSGSELKEICILQATQLEANAEHFEKRAMEYGSSPEEVSIGNACFHKSHEDSLLALKLRGIAARALAGREYHLTYEEALEVGACRYSY